MPAILLVLTLVLLFAATALPRVLALPPPFWAHLVLVVGVMSLIFAAMQHFVPVLARVRGARGWLAKLPWAMACAGVLAAWGFSGLGGRVWIGLAAAVALAGCAWMLAWIVARARDCIGPAHPGLAWYGAALACLFAGLLAVLAMPLWPEGHAALRAFHLHINLYGFVGLTAVGTLQVLMPTVVGRPDPEAAARLRRDLPWALAGALVLAASQAVAPAWAWLGIVLWAWPLGRMMLAWWRLFRCELFAWHGGAPALAAAALGFVAALLASLEGLAPTAGPLALFLPGFLFALVSGAAGHLAPVWFSAGARETVLERDRRRLNRYSGARALFFLSAAALPLLGYRCAGMAGLAGLLWFGWGFVAWLAASSDRRAAP